MRTYYVAVGSVRGSCGHSHRSPRTAGECVRRDAIACQRQGGYSDRTVERTDDEPLTDDEHDTALLGIRGGAQ